MNLLRRIFLIAGILIITEDGATEFLRYIAGILLGLYVFLPVFFPEKDQEF